jgi:hypothetical protein
MFHSTNISDIFALLLEFDQPLRLNDRHDEEKASIDFVVVS